MNRDDFKQLANLRIKEAKILLDAGSYEGAYYPAGYAVECALKACIAKQTRRYDFPPDPSKIRDIYVHDLTKLLERAGLKARHDAEKQLNASFRSNWATVKDWSEQRRYDHSIATASATDLYNAITDQRDGVLIWLEKYW